MSELNKLEIEILERIANKYPIIKSHIPFLTVRDRVNTGVGMYVNFDYTTHDVSALVPPNMSLSTNENVELRELVFGLGFELDVSEGEIKYIELFTYGENWDGKVNEFAFR